MHEIEPLIINRPHRVVVVRSAVRLRPIDLELAGVRTSPIRDEQRFAFAVDEVRQTLTVSGPREAFGTANQEGLRPATRQRHAQILIFTARTEPDLPAVL